MKYQHISTQTMVNPTSPRSIGSIAFWCFPRSSHSVHPRLFRLSKHHPNKVHHHGRIARKPVELRTHRHSWWASVVRWDPLWDCSASSEFWATAGEWIKLSCKYWELEILTNLNKQYCNYSGQRTAGNSSWLEIFPSAWDMAWFRISSHISDSGWFRWVFHLLLEDEK